jgi:hypothetical protein
MQFVLLLHLDRDLSMEKAAVAEREAAYTAYTRALIDAGAMRGGERLGAAEEGAVVWVARGNTVVHDGPYPDTKELVGGLYVIEAADLDEAVRWAARCPAATHGRVEVRASVPAPRAS